MDPRRALAWLGVVLLVSALIYAVHLALHEGQLDEEIEEWVSLSEHLELSIEPSTIVVDVDRIPYNTTVNVTIVNPTNRSLDLFLEITDVSQPLRDFANVYFGFDHILAESIVREIHISEYSNETIPLEVHVKGASPILKGVEYQVKLRLYRFYGEYYKRAYGEYDKWAYLSIKFV